jgi:K+-transporting ATPase KdpF subunit
VSFLYLLGGVIAASLALYLLAALLRPEWFE